MKFSASGEVGRGQLVFHSGNILRLLIAENHTEIDGGHATFRDDLLDKFVGSWRVTGNVVGQPLEQDSEVKWVLKLQFVKLHIIRKPPKDSVSHLAKHSSPSVVTTWASVMSPSGSVRSALF
jgi:hypothetical protein